jgi:hypothetical protein
MKGLEVLKGRNQTGESKVINRGGRDLLPETNYLCLCCTFMSSNWKRALTTETPSSKRQVDVQNKIRRCPVSIILSYAEQMVRL